MTSDRYRYASKTVDRFVRRFGESYRLLAYYAALPFVLTPELLGYLRSEFLHGKVPWVAEVDLLLSDLCSQIGYEQYVMEPGVRANLQAEMRERLGDEPMQAVARLLIQYVRQISQSRSFMRDHELQAQQWAAMAYLDEHRETVAREIVASFQAAATRAQPGANVDFPIVDYVELDRLSSIMRELAPQLGAYPKLVSYAKDVERVLADSKSALLERRVRAVRVLGVDLVMPEVLAGRVVYQAQSDESITVRSSRSDVSFPYKYEVEYFFGRDDIVAQITSTLHDINANQRRQRSILVESPSKRGSTWLLRKIENQLQIAPRDYVETTPRNVGFARPIVCFFESHDFMNELSYSEELKCKLLSRLWIAVQEHIPALSSPFGIAKTDTYEEKCEKIRQRFSTYPIASLLTEIRSKINEASPPILLILILDGMDEIAVNVLMAFEREFIAPLFRSLQSRLLASRRVDSLEHRWREPLIKQHAAPPIRLERFTPEECINQIEYILKQKGAPLTFADLQAQMKTSYPWANPGVNAFLVERAIDNSNKNMEAAKNKAFISQKDLISQDDIHECLMYLMRSSRDPAPIDAQSFEYIDRMIRAFPDTDILGAPRHRINPVLDNITNRDRDEFLGRLQDRGIGYFGFSGNYIIHSDFVELFRELQARKFIWQSHSKLISVIK